jgi:hypothetical protein
MPKWTNQVIPADQASAYGLVRQLDGSYGVPGHNYTTIGGNPFKKNKPAGPKPAQGGVAKPGAGRPVSPSPGTPEQPSSPAAPTKQNLSYKTGINAERPAINAGNVLERAGKEGRLAGVTSGAAKDFLKGQQSEDSANLKRGMSLENAQQNMAAQANRSELFQAGLAQQVDMNSKMAQHRANQAGMAVDWFQKMMQSRQALMQSLMK